MDNYLATPYGFIPIVPRKGVRALSVPSESFPVTEWFRGAYKAGCGSGNIIAMMLLHLRRINSAATRKDVEAYYWAKFTEMAVMACCKEEEFIEWVDTTLEQLA